MDYTMIGRLRELDRAGGRPDARHFSAGIVLTEYTAAQLKALLPTRSVDNRGCFGHVARQQAGGREGQGQRVRPGSVRLDIAGHERSTVNESSFEGIGDIGK